MGMSGDAACDVCNKSANELEKVREEKLDSSGNREGGRVNADTTISVVDVGTRSPERADGVWSSKKNLTAADLSIDMQVQFQFVSVHK